MDASALSFDGQSAPTHWMFSHVTFSPFTDFVAFFFGLILDYVDLSPFTDFVGYLISSDFTDFVKYFVFSHSIADHVDKTQCRHND